MKRSKRHILVPYCALSQGVRADTIVRKYPAIVTELAEYLIKKEINIMQMPCPELDFDGIHRKPCGKRHYDRKRNRIVCREIAEGIVDKVLLLESGGYEIACIMGVDYSPSCAVDYIQYLRQENKRIPGCGIFIEELKTVLAEKGLNIPMIGIQVYNIDETLHKLDEIINQTH